MTTVIAPLAEELGSECRACDLGAGDYYCQCADQARCWACNELIKYGLESKVEGFSQKFHPSCSLAVCQRCGMFDCDCALAKGGAA